MKNILFINGTSIVSGAEYVLGDYLHKTKKIKQISLVHSDIDAANVFYSSFNFNKKYRSKYLNPTGATKGIKGLFSKIYNFICSFFIFYKIFKNQEIDKVIGNNTGDVIYSLYSFLFNKKHINCIHDMIEKDTFTGKVIKLFDKFIFQYIAVSEAVKLKLIELGIDENKIKIVYNGLEYNNNYTEKDIQKEIVFGYIGGIDDRKNPIEFTKFIKIAQNVLIDYNVKGIMIYGFVANEKLYSNLKDFIKLNNLNIELLGKVQRENMVELYKQIHFLVLTSKNDPLPTVVLEAFNTFTPVIGHNIDGVPEMIKNGHNGFLYNTEDDFTEILEKIKSIDYKKCQINSNSTIKEKFKINKKVELFDDLLF